MKKENEETEEIKKIKNKKRCCVIEEPEKDLFEEKLKDANKILYGDRFEIDITQIYGKGAFGEIFLAIDHTTNTQCALKRVEYFV